MHNFEIKTPYLICKENKVYILNYHEIDNINYEYETYYLDDYEVKMNGQFLINNLKILYNINSLEDGKNLSVNITLDNINQLDNSNISLLLDIIHKDISGIQII
jgi:hypothetical protein